MISDRRGRIIYASTFYGRNWFFKRYEKGLRHEGGYASFLFPTSSGPCFQSAAGRAELAMTREDTPRVIYDQEYDCIAAANLAAVFREEDLLAVTRGACPPGPQAGRRYLLACDIGRRVDPPAQAVMDDTGLVCWSESLPLDTPYEIQAAHAAQLKRRWNATCVVDTTGGGGGGHAEPDEIVGVYRAAIPDLVALPWSHRLKKSMVEGLMVEIEKKNACPLSIPASLTGLHHELEVYEYLQRPTYWVYRAPEGEHDDQVSALLMLAHARRRGWFPDPAGRPLSQMLS
jgi:hypothetical protein